MTNEVAAPTTLRGVLQSYADPFRQQNTYNLNFEQECNFAYQQLAKSDYNITAAKNNPQALRNSITNVAAVGISLNPALALAYLVPRSPGKNQDPEICLDVSFRGMVALATASGAIRWAAPELVYEDEDFQWINMRTDPQHSMRFDKDSMRSRNGIEGIVAGYCVTSLGEGQVLVTHMTRADLDHVMSTSMARNGPWKTWPLEMMRKTLVKRAAKTWPQTAEQRVRLDQAIAIVNEHEGMQEVAGEAPGDLIDIPQPLGPDKIKRIVERLRATDSDPDKFLAALGQVKLDGLTTADEDRVELLLSKKEAVVAREKAQYAEDNPRRETRDRA